MKTFKGYMFTKLDNIGSKSEGPKYFLQLLEKPYDEVVVAKRVELWQEDPMLHQFLGKKVTIEGEIIDKKIKYQKVKLNTM